MQTLSPLVTARRRATASNAALVVLAACVLVTLAGCGAKPARHADKHGGAVASSGAAAGSAPAQRRGGAYYKDDGPDDVLPAYLDDIPDAVPRIEPFHPPALRPYSVFGQQYVPMTELGPYRERGHASWYGRRFHGNPTSTGEPYDMYAMTAAHPTLPLPSYVRVTNLENGRSVVVRVNDRGPFLRGRLIDLSYAAAHRLGYVNAGSALVEVEAITHDDIRVALANGQPAVPRASQGAVAAAVATRADVPPPQQLALAPLAPPAALNAPPAALPVSTATAPAPAPAVAAAPQGGAYLQLGAFSTSANAEDLFVRARRQLSTLADRLHLLDDGGRYRLQVGPFASVDEARLEAGRIGALLDLQPFVVMR
jgi:rare lipoprotein A